MLYRLSFTAEDMFDEKQTLYLLLACTYIPHLNGMYAFSGFDCSPVTVKHMAALWHTSFCPLWISAKVTSLCVCHRSNHTLCQASGSI